MNVRKILLIISGVMGLSSGFAASQSEAAAIRQCRLHDESCACEVALQKNTIGALEEFFRLYPLGNKPSACGALAFNALQNFAANNPPGNFGGGSSGNGYGG